MIAFPQRPPIARWLSGIAALLAVMFLALQKAEALSAADYKAQRISGWTVHIEKAFDGYDRKKEALRLLRSQLNQIARIVPPAALPKLRKVPIWLSINHGNGAAYHPSAQWLADNGEIVEMAGAVEIRNVDHFIDWSIAQPQIMLHELAHAWHHQFLPGGFENPDVKSAYEKAVLRGKYEKVLYFDGSFQKHYALTNQMEYFAECSEAYFAKNDFHPFVRKQFLKFDPAGLRMIERVWGVAPP
jgi:hypothetical protein